MFGYVRPAWSKLSPGQMDVYRGVYCGLCHTMGERYGFVTRFALTYDFTFLAMVLAQTGANLQPCLHRCPAHPLRRKKSCLDFEGLETAADESLVLTWHKLKDDIADDGFWAGLPAHLSGLALHRAYRQAAERQCAFDKEVAVCLRELHTLECQACSSMDRTADTFARILKAAAPASGDFSRDRAIGQMLYHVGRWIYLVDAWDDLESDRAKGCYNPLDARFNGRPEEHQEELRITMTHSLRLSISACHLVDFGEWGGIIENILYFGLPTVQEAVLTGQWQQKTGRKANERSISGIGRGLERK